VLVVEDEPYMAEAIRDGLRLEAIAADIAGDGDTALELLRFNAYDIAVLDRDIPGPSGDEHDVRIDRRVRHPLYKKTVARSNKLAAHDETNIAHVGDTVRLMETRRTSKSKRWRVVEIVERAK